MEILLVEPFFTGSHQAWAQGYANHSRHSVRILSLGGAHWKWRMHGGAVTLARRFFEGDYSPAFVLATDMLDVTTFLALTRSRTAGVPTAIYFHENQITYPWSPRDRDARDERDRHYGFINYASALACDRVFFNSAYHMESFFSELPDFLGRFPDHHEVGNVERIRAKSSVLPLGFDLFTLDMVAESAPGEDAPAKGERPLVLWNHRWEYDKNPEEFFEALRTVKSQGLDFDVALLGESYDVIPACFADAEAQFGDRIVQFGYLRERADYARWLHRADILPVTSNQDYFGSSVIEAIYCGCFPLLPERLAFPELFPFEIRPSCFYEGFDDLVRRLATAIQQIDRIRRIGFRDVARRFDWTRVAQEYDACFSEIASRK
jgi:glycosyltransferase involved in cell wall biosynthesis